MKTKYELCNVLLYVRGVSIIINSIVKRTGRFRNNNSVPLYFRRILFFTQPAHVIMALAVTLVAASMFPGNIKRTLNANGEVVKPRSFVNFVYLAAFCTHVGAQFWMTFISGELFNADKGIERRTRDNGRRIRVRRNRIAYARRRSRVKKIKHDFTTFTAETI